MKVDKSFLKLSDVIENLENISQKYSINPDDSDDIEFAKAGLIFILTKHRTDFEEFVSDDYWPSSRDFETCEEAIEWSKINNIQSGAIVKVADNIYIVTRTSRDESYRLTSFLDEKNIGEPE